MCLVTNNREAFPLPHKPHLHSQVVNGEGLKSYESLKELPETTTWHSYKVDVLCFWIALSHVALGHLLSEKLSHHRQVVALTCRKESCENFEEDNCISCSRRSCHPAKSLVATTLWHTGKHKKGCKISSCSEAGSKLSSTMQDLKRPDQGDSCTGVFSKPGRSTWCQPAAGERAPGRVAQGPQGDVRWSVLAIT